MTKRDDDADSKDKLIRVVLIAKQILSHEEFNQIAEEFNLERTVLQFTDYESLTFFISRIPLKDLMSIFKNRDDLIQSDRPFSQNDVGKNHLWLDKIKHLCQT